MNSWLSVLVVIPGMPIRVHADGLVDGSVVLHQRTALKISCSLLEYICNISISDPLFNTYICNHFYYTDSSNFNQLQNIPPLS